MAKRIVTKIGDIFCVEIDGIYKVYFQYIANDLEQLNSSVIRVFKRRYPLDANPKMDDIVKDDVIFYAHTILRVGIEDGAWCKVGRSDDLGLDKLSQVWFGSAQNTYIDSESMEIVFCDPQENFVIWHINEEGITVGNNLQNQYKNVEPGSVIPYNWIILRIKLGYDPGCDNVYYHIKRVPWDDVNSYTKWEDTESDDVAYFHFLGKNLISELIVTPTGKIYLDREHPQCGGYEFLDMEFGDINWKYNQFITAEEFNEAWGDHKW